MNLISNLNKETGITVVMVTHEQEAADFADRIVHFKDGHIENDTPNGGSL
jgi:putative ABC transport system ATP-binding protein